MATSAELDNIGVVNSSGRSNARSSGAEAVATDASTRQKVLDLLLEHGSMTAAQLASELGLTTAGVRRHLAILDESNQITSREEGGPRGRGRPARHYLLTSEGRRSFGQAYDDLALSAISELVAAAGPEALDRLANKRFAALEADFRRRRAEDPGADPAQLLADALNAAGYFASTDEGGELCQHHCPVANVAEQFPQLCEAETHVFSRLLGIDVSRLATIASGDVACRVHLGGTTVVGDPISVGADRKVSA